MRRGLWLLVHACLLACGEAEAPGAPVDLVAGGHHACVSTSRAGVCCWGRGAPRVVGYSPSRSALEPHCVRPGQFDRLLGAGDTVCLLDGAQLRIWGRGTGGMPAGGADHPGVLVLDHVPQSADGLICTVDSEGSVRSWHEHGMRLHPLAGRASRCRAASGGYAAIEPSGRAHYWSHDDSATSLHTPAAEHAVEQATFVDFIPLVGSACGVRFDGSVVCWTEWASSPDFCERRVAGLSAVSQLEIVGDYGCARAAGGSVSCFWIRDCTSEIVARRIVHANARDAAVGFHFGCALVGETSIVCWGTINDSRAEFARPGHDRVVVIHLPPD